MFKSFKEQKELKKKRKAEGKVVELPNKDEVLEVSTEPVDTKIEKENKNSFEEFKVLYKGQIDDKCLEDYGTIEDKKLWEDTAKELFMASEDYIPDENNKAEKIEEGKKLNEDHQLYYDDIQGMPTSERHLLWKQYHEEDFEDTEEGNDKFWNWAEEEFPVKEIEESKKLNEKDLGNNTYTDIDEAEYYRNKELYYHNQLARYKDAMEKARRACKKKGIKLKEESKSERYQVREFDGSGAKFGVFDTKEKKFVQKGSKYVMDAACKDLNEKGKVTESSIIKYTLKEMMNKKQEAIEEGASIFELKFDCSNEDTFGIGYELENSISDILYKVADKVKSGMLDSSILDINGNKIGSYGIGYEGVESGLSESKKVEEGIRNELIQLKKDNRGLYDYVANNYYKMSQEELKEIALDAIYVANNDAKIIDEYTERMDESVNNDIEKVKKDSIKKGLYTESEDVPNITWILENYDWDVDIMTEEQLGSDYLYRKLCRNVDEAARFNYHSDYWGDADSYQDANIELMEQIEPYVGKEVIVDFDDGSQKYKILGIAIDKQYNSLSHTCILAEELGEPKTEGIEKEVNVTDANEDINSVMVTYISNQTFMKYYNLDRPLTEKELDILKLKIKNKEMYVTDFKDKLNATEVNSRKELIPNTYVMKIKENDVEDLEEVKEVPEHTDGYDAVDYFWEDEDVRAIQELVGGAAEVEIDNNKSVLQIKAPQTKYINGGTINGSEELANAIIELVHKQHPDVKIDYMNQGTTFILRDKVTWKNKKQESQVSDYTFKELNKVVNDKGNDFKIQIAGSEDKTNWLNIDKEDLQAIYQALQNKKAK